MKIDCVREKLIDVLSKAERTTGKNLTLPILSNVLLEVKNNTLTVRATNLDLGVEISMPVKQISEGIIAIPGSILISFLMQLHSEKNVSLELVDDTLHVKASKSFARIKTISTEDFPTIPKLDDSNVISLPASILVKGLKSVWFSASPQSMKPELASVYIHADDEYITFAATDSFRLAEKKIKNKKGGGIGTVLIPFKNIADIIKILDGISDDIDIRIDETQISFSYENTYMVSRIIDGTFPDYRQIIAKEFKTEIVLLKKDFIEALKTAHIFSNTFNQIQFTINPAKKEFFIQTQNTDVGESIQSVDATLSGDSVNISFNYKYVFDAFQAIDADSLQISFNGLGKPLLMKGVGDPTFQYIVMSMNK